MSNQPSPSDSAGSQNPLGAGGVLVLGAAGGIGSALCRRLKSSGRRLFLAGRREQPLAELGNELGAPWASLDARDSAQVAAVFARAHAELGSLQGAVNSIGSILLKPAARTSDAEYRDVLAQNLDTAFFCLREAAQHLAPGGSLVLLSSAAASFGLANHEAIAAAKAGVEGLVRAGAATLAPRGLRVNAVAPGLVDTPLARPWTEAAAARQASEKLHPLGRIGRADEVAAAIAWLLDPTQAWITGAVIPVDGGLSNLRGRS
jgi:NAD(P)-dependent dehydrogenase (short-subunit alcohol dehydrogenase family)